MRGDFGATRVAPAQLFDGSRRDGPGPPADALDVQFRAPLTFSLLVDALLRNDRELDARTCYQMYEQVITYTVERVQFACGYVLDERGEEWPARLELGALGESDVPGIETVRVHHHLYIGRTAVRLDDGRRLPVSREGGIRRGMRNMVWPDYLSKLRQLSEGVLGLRWDCPPGRLSDEIVDPPLHEHMAGHELGVCPSPWGRRETWEQPTPELVRAEAETAARIAREDYTSPGRVLDY